MATRHYVIAQQKVAYDGEYRSKGERFLMSEDVLEAFVDQGLVELDENQNGAEPEAPAEVVWGVAGMTPEQYLKRFPNGPRAKLAETVIAAAVAAQTSE